MSVRNLPQRLDEASKMKVSGDLEPYEALDEKKTEKLSGQLMERKQSGKSGQSENQYRFSEYSDCSKIAGAEGVVKARRAFLIVILIVIVRFAKVRICMSKILDLPDLKC